MMQHRALSSVVLNKVYTLESVIATLNSAFGQTTILLLSFIPSSGSQSCRSAALVGGSAEDAGTDEDL